MVDKNYTGYLIAANPKNPADEWARSVILIVSHTKDITVGLQINKPYNELALGPIALRLGIESVPNDPVYIGGDEYPNKIQVIHSLDWQGLTTIPLNDWIGITGDVSILSAMSIDQGPRWTRACFGFKIWDDGLFDLEMSAHSTAKNLNRWSLAPGTVLNTFENKLDDQWGQVLEESAKFAVDLWFAD